MVMLTEKELSILSILRENSRKTLVDISKETNIPVSTVFDNINKLEQKAIKKHVSIMDFSKLGFNARANIMVKVNRDLREEAKKFNAILRLRTECSAKNKVPIGLLPSSLIRTYSPT